MALWLASLALLVTLVTGQVPEHRRRRLHAEMYADLHGEGSPSPTAHVVIAGHVSTDDEAENLQPMEPAVSASATCTNASASGQTPASPAQPEIGFDYGICVGCVVAIVLAQAPTHAPTGCWSLPPLQQSVLRVCAARASNAATADRMYADVAEQLQQVGVPPELSMSLIDGLKRWVADVAASDTA